MSGTQWPRVLDMTEDDSKKALRSIELVAYSSVVSAFRAQGDLTDRKSKLLTHLRELLGISGDRHRAEVRRSVNDEKLSTIAFHLTGQNHEGQWLVEGRRLAPLSERLTLHTAYSSLAQQSANVQANKNALLPQPSLTGNKEQMAKPGTLSNPPAVSQPMTPANTTSSIISPALSSSGTPSAPVTKFSRSRSPNTNIVLLPSGTSIHIKGGLNLDEDEDITGAKRRRIASTDAVVATSKQIVGRGGQITPMKLTLSKASSTSAGAQQKVLLVQSPSTQKSTVTLTSSSITTTVTTTKTTVPIVKSITPASSHSSIVYPLTPSTSSTLHTESSVSTGPRIHTQQALTIQKPRTKATITASLSPARLPGHKTPITVSRHGVVLPVPVEPASPGIATARTGVHVKQEGAMKIITSSNSKLLPKPNYAVSSSVVVVTSAVTSSTLAAPQRNTVITRPGSTAAVAINNNKVISIHTGGKVLSSGHVSSANTLKTHKSPGSTTTYRGVSLTSTSTTASTSGKAGSVVIVQQPGQVMRGGNFKPGRQIISTVSNPPLEKEVIGLMQKQGAPLDTNSLVKSITKATSLPTTIKTITASAVGVGVKSTDSYKVKTDGKVTSPYINQLQQSVSSQSHSHIIVTSLPSTQTLPSSSLGSKSSTSPSQHGTAAKAIPSSTLWLQSSSYPLFTTVDSEYPSQRAPALSGTQTTLATGKPVSTPSVPTSESVTTTVPPKMDIFSSALAEAEIFLDPYEFIDEEDSAAATTLTSPVETASVLPLWPNAPVDSSAVMPLAEEGGETNPAVYHLSQGAAILSGDLPFITQPAVTTASYDLSDDLLNTSHRFSVIGSTLDQSATTISTVGSVSSIGNTSTVSGSNQIILPKGKEAIRIVTGVPATTTGLAGLTVANRAQLSQIGGVDASSLHTVDIQPKQSHATPTSYVSGGLAHTSPTIDTKILILPPGIGQPPTPVSAPTSASELFLPTTHVETKNFNPFVPSSQSVSVAAECIGADLEKSRASSLQTLESDILSLAKNKQLEDTQVISSAVTALLELNQEPIAESTHISADDTVVVTMENLLPSCQSTISSSAVTSFSGGSEIKQDTNESQNKHLQRTVVSSAPIRDSTLMASAVSDTFSCAPIVDTSKLTVVTTADLCVLSNTQPVVTTTITSSSITTLPSSHSHSSLKDSLVTSTSHSSVRSSDGCLAESEGQTSYQRISEAVSIPKIESETLTMSKVIEAPDTATTSKAIMASEDATLSKEIAESEVVVSKELAEPEAVSSKAVAESEVITSKKISESKEVTMSKEVGEKSTDKSSNDEIGIASDKDNIDQKYLPTDDTMDLDFEAEDDDLLNDQDAKVIDKLTIVGPEGNLTMLEYEKGLYIEKTVVTDNTKNTVAKSAVIEDEHAKQAPVESSNSGSSVLTDGSEKCDTNTRTEKNGDVEMIIESLEVGNHEMDAEVAYASGSSDILNKAQGVIADKSNDSSDNYSLAVENSSTGTSQTVINTQESSTSVSDQKVSPAYSSQTLISVQNDPLPESQVQCVPNSSNSNAAQIPDCSIAPSFSAENHNVSVLKDVGEPKTETILSESVHLSKQLEPIDFKNFEDVKLTTETMAPIESSISSILEKLEQPVVTPTQQLASTSLSSAGCVDPTISGESEIEESKVCSVVEEIQSVAPQISNKVTFAISDAFEKVEQTAVALSIEQPSTTHITEKAEAIISDRLDQVEPVIISNSKQMEPIVADTIVADTSEQVEPVTADNAKQVESVVADHAEQIESVSPGVSEEIEPVFGDSPEQVEKVIADNPEQVDAVIADNPEQVDAVIAGNLEQVEPVIAGNSEQVDPANISKQIEPVIAGVSEKVEHVVSNLEKAESVISNLEKVESPIINVSENPKPLVASDIEMSESVDVSDLEKVQQTVTSSLEKAESVVTSGITKVESVVASDITKAESVVTSGITTVESGVGELTNIDSKFTDQQLHLSHSKNENSVSNLNDSASVSDSSSSGSHSLFGDDTINLKLAKANAPGHKDAPQNNSTNIAEPVSPTPLASAVSEDTRNSSESSPPLRPKHFEKVYRPRKSVGNSNDVGKYTSTNNDTSVNSAAESDSQNMQPNQIYSVARRESFNSDNISAKLDCETRTPLLILQRTPTKDVPSSIVNGTSQLMHLEKNSIGKLEEMDGNSDYLTDSCNSVSNGPNTSTIMSQGEESDEEDTTVKSDSSTPTQRGNVSHLSHGRKRRRKSDHSPFWFKGALGLLKRVMMYRGVNRPKGEHGAAAWFLKPVSDDEAPGYSAIISQPMDLSTVKRKLETNQYSSLEDFKSDMMLIYSNCCVYNPPEHNVRRDCELVFVYFRQEYEKLVNKLHQQATGEAERKKVKMEANTTVPPT